MSELILIQGTLDERRREKMADKEEELQQLVNYRDMLAALGFTDDADFDDVRNRLVSLLETEFMYDSLTG